MNARKNSTSSSTSSTMSSLFFFFFYFLLLFSFFAGKYWTEDLTHAKHILYHWAMHGTPQHSLKEWNKNLAMAKMKFIMSNNSIKKLLDMKSRNIWSNEETWWHIYIISVLGRWLTRGNSEGQDHPWLH